MSLGEAEKADVDVAGMFRRLAAINRAITTSLDSAEVLRLIADNTAELVRAEVCLLLLDELGDGRLRVCASRGVDEERVNDFSAEMEETIVVRLRELLRLDAETALVCVPVLGPTALSGFLAIARKTKLSAEEHWLLSALADQAVIALRNASIFEMEAEKAEDERARLIETLRDANSRLVVAVMREQEAHDLLEERVDERTRDLQEMTRKLLAEVKERQRAEEQVKGLLRKMVGVQEEERRRLARDLHDHLGQQLTVLRLDLERIKGEELGREELARQVERMEGTLRQLDSDVDFMAWELRPASLDQTGLASALEKLVRQWSEHTRIPAEFYAEGLGDARLPPRVETHLYRIVQEALGNVAKHAGASRASILFELRDRQALFIIEDDGRGFDPVAAANGSGSMGLVNMRERAALVGGTLEIEASPGAGTTLFVRVPVSSV
jgi:glucose-6-phosphate-specific signal transduction histidine kinase